MPCHVGKARFAEIVEEALASLPDRFAAYLEEVPVQIVDRPTADQRLAAGIDADDLLLGLYVGTSLADRSVLYDFAYPSTVFLFQHSIELTCDDVDQLREQVRITTLHEIGHHFGMTEQDLEDLGYG